MPVTIRPASVEDLPAILAILNHAIETSLAIWQDEPVDLDNRRAWLQARQSQNHPVLVAELESKIVGFAATGPFRFGSGFAKVCEDSVYVHDAHRGCGLGEALLSALVVHARFSGFTHIIAVIGLPNPASLILHQHQGFSEVGRLPGIGRKFGQSLDLCLMQKDLLPEVAET